MVTVEITKRMLLVMGQEKFLLLLAIIILFAALTLTKIKKMKKPRYPNLSHYICPK